MALPFVWVLLEIMFCIHLRLLHIFLVVFLWCIYNLS